MSITMVNASNFDDGQDAVGSECVAEWQNIIDNALNLVSPWTGNMSAGGNKLVSLALGNAVTPSLSVLGNTSTGIWFADVNTLNIATNSNQTASFSNALIGLSAAAVTINAAGANMSLTALGIIGLQSGSYIDMTGVIRVGNAATTGVAPKSIIMDNTCSIQWINAAGTTAADHFIQVSSANNMQFCIPDLAGQRYYYLWGPDALFALTQELDGAGILFNGLSSSDHSAPLAGGCVIYVVDNGGKMELRARFPSGVAQLIAAEP